MFNRKGDFYVFYIFNWILQLSKNNKKVLTNKIKRYILMANKGGMQMKILGEKSLSSRVIVGLNILFTAISAIDILVLGIIAKVIMHITSGENVQNNIGDLTLFSMIIATGIIALFIIYQFIKIFQNLKSNTLFCENNSKRLNTVSYSCFIISLLYFAITILIGIMLKTLEYELMLHYILAFSIMLMIIFIVSGIGIKILNEIYKRAIEYKEENDFTI